MEVKRRRRKAGEPLRTLHSDIRRLTAFAYAAHERIACDYFVHALDEPEFALRLRERTPQDLDSALQVANNLKSGRTTLTVRNDRKSIFGIGEHERSRRLLRPSLKSPTRLRISWSVWKSSKCKCRKPRLPRTQRRRRTNVVRER